MFIPGQTVRIQKSGIQAEWEGKLVCEPKLGGKLIVEYPGGYGIITSDIFAMIQVNEVAATIRTRNSDYNIRII